MTEIAQSSPKKRQWLKFAFAVFAAGVVVRIAPGLFGLMAPDEAGRMNKAAAMIRAYDERNTVIVKNFEQTRADQVITAQMRARADEARALGFQIGKDMARAHPDDEVRKNFKQYMSLQCDIATNAGQSVRRTVQWNRARTWQVEYNASVRNDMNLFEKVAGSSKLLADECTQ